MKNMERRTLDRKSEVDGTKGHQVGLRSPIKAHAAININRLNALSPKKVSHRVIDNSNLATNKDSKVSYAFCKFNSNLINLSSFSTKS